MRTQSGFTLIELMIVIAIIGILAAIAVPQFSIYVSHAYKAEGHQLAGDMRKEVCAFFDTVGILPDTNQTLGLPEPGSIRGKYVDALSIEDGAVLIKFNQNCKKGNLSGKIMRLVPQVNEDYPTGPLIWEWINPPKENESE